MPVVRNITGTTDGGTHAVHLLLQEGEVRLLGSDPEKAMMEIEVRARTIGRVLEEILREPHNGPDWGLNE
jgi:hypothetical protein